MSRRFGQLFGEYRRRSGQSLRAFALMHGHDPGNLSRLERGRSAPPKSQMLVAQFADQLGLVRESQEWQEFHDLAAAESGRVPEDILSDSELVEKLPLVFRTLRGARGASNEELDALAEKIRKA